MAARERVGDAAARELRRIARLVREEMASRDWGAEALEQLEAEGGGDDGETVSPSERAAVRRVLAMIERTESVALAATRAVEVLAERKGEEIPIAVAGEVVAALEDQTGRAVGDAFAALVASARREDRRGRTSIAREAARLGALRPSASDLRTIFAAIAAVSPGRRGKPKQNSFTRALQDVVAAAAFVDRTVGRVDEILARGVGTEEKVVGRVALGKLMAFVARCASFAQRVATLRIAHAGDVG